MFARKLLRPCGDVTPELIQNEMRAVTKLCKPGSHENIVAVFEFGKLPRSYFHFIDMELCDLNLETYIYRDWTPYVKERAPDLVAIDDMSTTAKLSQIGDIMMDIAAGVAFIHSHQEVHRDLKPRNGIQLYP